MVFPANRVPLRVERVVHIPGESAAGEALQPEVGITKVSEVLVPAGRTRSFRRTSGQVLLSFHIWGKKASLSIGQFITNGKKIFYIYLSISKISIKTKKNVFFSLSFSYDLYTNMDTATDATAMMIPARPLKEIFRELFIIRNSDALPMIIARIARVTVRIAHDRIPRMRVRIPIQFLFFFFDTEGDATVTGGVTDAGGTAGIGEATGTGGLAAGRVGSIVIGTISCPCTSGFPQFLQNRLIAGFSVPHSRQNIDNLPMVTERDGRQRSGFRI
jgi:hypothetical protein